MLLRFCLLGVGLGAGVIAIAGAAGAQSDDRYQSGLDAARHNFRTEQPRNIVGKPPLQAPQRQQAPGSIFDNPQLRITVTPKPGEAGAGQAPRAGGNQLVCVRTCDGYFFPVGGGVTDRAVAEFMCRANCPGAPTKLFTRSGDGIENAVGADRSLYSRLAAGLRFQTNSSPTCSCRRPNGTITSGPVYDDPTLKVGDVIVVSGKAVVFRGAAKRPYTERDFAPLDQSPLSADARQQVASILLLRPSRAKATKRTEIASNGGRMRVVLPSPFDLQGFPPSISAFAPPPR